MKRKKAFITKNYMEDKTMLTEACILLGGGVGALVGAALSTTETGQELDEKLNDALDLYEDRISDHIPDLGNIKDLIGGN